MAHSRPRRVRTLARQNSPVSGKGPSSRKGRARYRRRPTRRHRAPPDADIVVYDPLADHVIRAADMVANVDYNPYEGFTTRGSIQQVWLRGRLAVEHGTVLAGPDGKYILRGKNCL